MNGYWKDTGLGDHKPVQGLLAEKGMPLKNRQEHVLVLRPFFPLVKALRLAGIQVTTLGSADDSWREDIVTNEDQVVESAIRQRPRSFWMKPLRSIMDVASALREQQTQTVLVNALKDLAAVFLAIRFLTPRDSRPTIIAMSHNPQIWQQPRYAWLAAKVIHYLSDGFVALASSHREQLILLGVPAERIVVLPNPYDLDWTSRISLNARPERFTGHRVRIVYVATLCQRKAQHVLIRAAATVAARHPHLEVILVGEEGREKGYKRKLLSLMDELHIRHNVTLAGFASQAQVAEMLASCDMVAFPTLAEMMPRAVIEGMIIGKPIVASAVGGIPDLIRHRETGLLAQPGDADDLAEAICELVEDPDLASQLASAGQTFVREYCAPERVGRLFQEFYGQIGR